MLPLGVGQRDPRLRFHKLSIRIWLLASSGRSRLTSGGRRELLKDLRLAPAWMHPIFRELAEEEA
jgi:hypothetical protein